jgi:hypothetical protein
LFSGLLVSSAAVAIMLTASQGIKDVPNSDINPIRPLVGSAWGITGAWFVGLGLALVIPTTGKDK